MNVYVLFEFGGDDHNILGVFTSLEKAHRHNPDIKWVNQRTPLQPFAPVVSYGRLSGQFPATFWIEEQPLDPAPQPAA